MCFRLSLLSTICLWMFVVCLAHARLLVVTFVVGISLVAKITPLRNSGIPDLLTCISVGYINFGLGLLMKPFFGGQFSPKFDQFIQFSGMAASGMRRHYKSEWMAGRKSAPLGTMSHADYSVLLQARRHFMKEPPGDGMWVHNGSCFSFPRRNGVQSVSGTGTGARQPVLVASRTCRVS